MSDDKKIVKTLNSPNFPIPVPTDPRIRIEQIFLWRKKAWFNGTTYTSHGLGYSVENTADISMRLTFDLILVDKDGYTTNNIYFWEDIPARQRKRSYSNFYAGEAYEFGNYKLTQIGFAATPPRTPEGEAGLASRWEVTTKPNVTLSQLFSYGGGSSIEPKYFWYAGLGLAALFILSRCF